VTNLYPYLVNKNIDSIVMFPNAWKAGKLYNIYPTTLNWFTAQRNTQAYRTDSNKLLDLRGNNEPRLDYEYSDCPELFMEKYSINYFVYSNNFNFWTTSGGGSYINNNGTGPDGVVDSAAYFNNKVALQTIDFPGGVTTISIWAKKASDSACTLNLFIDGEQQFFSLTNEWELYTFRNLSASDISNCGFGVTEPAYIWNPQLEDSEYATSSIISGENLGERAQDVIYKDIISKNYYLAYFDVRLVDGATITELFEVIGSMNDGTLDVYLALGVSNTNEIIVNLYNNPDNQVINLGAYEDGIHKIAIKWDSVSLKIFVDGILEEDINNEAGVQPTATTRIDLGTIAGNYYPVRDRIRGFIYMGAMTDILPTDAELMQLTQLAPLPDFMISQVGEFLITQEDNNIITE
jgi:hypothetical protein